MKFNKKITSYLLLPLITNFTFLASYFCNSKGRSVKVLFLFLFTFVEYFVKIIFGQNSAEYFDYLSSSRTNFDLYYVFILSFSLVANKLQKNPIHCVCRLELYLLMENSMFYIEENRTKRENNCSEFKHSYFTSDYFP